MQANDDATPFRGFRSPSYTQVPDELFDELLPTLSGAELKVLLYIIRRTFGFKREADAISLAQMMAGITTHDGRVLDRGVGLSKPTLLGALRSLVERQIIRTERRRSLERGDEPTVYRLRFVEGDDMPDSGEKDEQGGEGVPHPVVKKLDHPVVKKSYPQDTVLQQTEGINSFEFRRRLNSRQNFFKIGDNPPPEPFDASQKPPPTIVAPNDIGEEEAKNVGGDPVPTPKRGRGRPPKQPYTEERQQILAYIEAFASQLGDQSPLASSVTRAYNLYLQSGYPLTRFVDALYQARARTREHSASIRTALPTDDPWGTKPKMAYFFAVLAEEVGLRDEA